MLNEYDCPNRESSENCDGPVTFELGGIRPDAPLCRAEVRRLIEENPKCFAGLLPVDLCAREEDKVIDLRIRTAVQHALSDMNEPVEAPGLKPAVTL